AHRRLDEHGPNELPEPPKPNPVLRFLSHFNDVLIYVLLVAAIITAFMGHWVDTIVIAAVAVINAVIGYIQEGRAEKALEGIRDMLSPTATVRRDGSWTEVEAADIVPGDVVRLRSGDRVPADLRLVESSSLRIEESALTGESEPAEKSTDEVDEDAGIGDRTSMAFSSSMIAGGSGRGVVVATGQQTEIGRISDMLSEVETLETPLTKQMNSFGKKLSLIIVVAAAVLFGLGWLLHDSDLEELFQAAIGFAVGAIPEGLPAILTITLARGVSSMASRNAITRKMTSIETLGSVTTICSDKTGTLTANEMTARTVVTPAHRYEVSGEGYAPSGEVSLDDEPVALADHPDLHAFVEAMAVANDTELTQGGGQAEPSDDDDATDDRWTISGEPTEGALMTLAAKLDFDAEAHQRTADIPFNSDNKYMAVQVTTPDGDDLVLIKGAPDRILDLCANQADAHDPAATADLDRDHWESVIDELSADGLRVLAAARRTASGDLGDDPGDGFTFDGLVGIVDPPRPEAIEAIELCRSAGIDVKMITGDHAGTAEAIGRELKLADEISTITGAELEELSDDELPDVAEKHNVFARVSPEHKLRLVKALQSRDHVVAMTGDGVNDAPALRRADVGVAMGIKGTEVTKEAADVVLADDNFSSIERAVEQGRTIYDNLRKSILFMLPTNGGESVVIIAAILLGFALPMSPLQILWVNMVIAVTLALALAYEPSEEGIMERTPREPGRPILDGVLLWRVIFVSALIGGAALAVFWTRLDAGVPLEEARTLTVNLIVLTQAFYLLNVKSLTGFSLKPSVLFNNWVIWACIGVLIALQLVFVYAPFMNDWFGTTPLGWQAWAFCAAVGLAIMAVVEVEKVVLRKVKAR
ncbi:MAG: cation-transporting P-type ATPase, partial [Propionibacteriaceae bacterium]|nr:cation-transporting P-type ATPase [Propionibacteriaceae bacterium]